MKVASVRRAKIFEHRSSAEGTKCESPARQCRVQVTDVLTR